MGGLGFREFGGRGLRGVRGLGFKLVGLKGLGFKTAGRGGRAGGISCACRVLRERLQHLESALYP